MSKNNHTQSKLFNEHITAVTEKSGKPRKQVRDAMHKARDEKGISFKDYDRYDLWKYNESEIEEKLMEAKAAKKLASQEKQIQKAMAKTGWEHNVAAEKMQKAQELTGCKYVEYYKLKLYNLSEDALAEGYQKRLKNQKLLKERIATVATETGWDEATSKANMMSAKKNYGILNSEYVKYGIYNAPNDRLIEYFAQQLILQQKRKRITENHCILSTAYSQGCSKEEAEELVTYMTTNYKLRLIDYIQYGFYRMNREEAIQKHKILVNKGKISKGRLSDKSIFAGVYYAGMTYDESQSAFQLAKEKYGLTNKEYYVNKFYSVSEDMQPRLVEKIMEERIIDEKAKIQKEAEKKENNKAYIARVVKESGWTEEEAIERMNRAKRISGASFENYSICRFWELTDEQQRSFFTIGFSKLITEKYSKVHTDTRRVLYYKDLFYDDFKDCLGRKCCSTVNISYDEFAKLFDGEDTILYKPRTGLGGHGIEFYNISNSDDLKAVYDDIMQKPLGVVESKINQHPEMQKLSKNSVNTLRIVTIRTNNPDHGIEVGKTHFVYGGVRMSGGESMVDNLHSGGMIAALDLEKGEICTPASNHLNEVFVNHPATGVRIHGFKIPCLDEAIEMIDRKCQELDIEGYYGWDIAISTDGPILVEGNNNPGSDGLQTPYAPTHTGMKHIFDKYI